METASYSNWVTGGKFHGRVLYRCGKDVEKPLRKHWGLLVMLGASTIPRLEGSSYRTSETRGLPVRSHDLCVKSRYLQVRGTASAAGPHEGCWGNRTLASLLRLPLAKPKGARRQGAC